MNKEYEEIEFGCGWTLAKFVAELISQSASGKLLCGTFNGHEFYSDTVSLDSAYKEIQDKTYYEHICEQKKWREDIEKHDREHKSAIPRLTREWIVKGHSVLSEDKWELWDKIVPVRLSDLYEGMELGMCLDIIKEIREKSIEDGIEMMKNQGHSGMSWGLMKSMVKEFSEKGEEFYNAITY